MQEAILNSAMTYLEHSIKFGVQRELFLLKKSRNNLPELLSFPKFYHYFQTYSLPFPSTLLIFRFRLIPTIEFLFPFHWHIDCFCFHMELYFFSCQWQLITSKLLRVETSRRRTHLLLWIIRLNWRNICYKVARPRSRIIYPSMSKRYTRDLPQTWPQTTHVWY